MKKTLVVLAVVASMVATMACGGNGDTNSTTTFSSVFGGSKFKNDMDSLSYCIGADMGLNINFGVKDLGLDKAAIVANIKHFIDNGDVESEEFMQEMQQLQMFQYTKFMPYMQVAMMHEKSDRTDTLPALPELYDDNFKREDITRYMAHSMAASVKGANIELNRPLFDNGIKDGLKAESPEPESINKVLRITLDQMDQVFTSYVEKMEAEAQAEFEATLKATKEACEKWLAKVEQMEGVKKTESGILYRIDREGNGKKPSNDTDVVVVNYEGKVHTGEVFDSSYERNEPATFALNQVIKGWTEGLKLVKVGGQITLWIPSDLAYGDQQRSELIVPGSALEFKVELLELNPKNK